MLNQIKQDLDQALKAQNKTKLMVLRQLWSELKNKEIDLQRLLNDQEVVTVIKKQVKILQEASALFQKGGREDLAKQNQAEIAVLTVYLPKEISDDQLQEHVAKLLQENKQITNQGQLIGLCVNKLKDQADSQRIVQAVKALI